jgi:hypothetical protein
MAATASNTQTDAWHGSVNIVTNLGPVWRHKHASVLWRTWFAGSLNRSRCRRHCFGFNVTVCALLPFTWAWVRCLPLMDAGVSTGMLRPMTTWHWHSIVLTTWHWHNTELQVLWESLLSHALNTHVSRYFIPHPRKRTLRLLAFLFKICTANNNELVSPDQWFQIRHTASPHHCTNTSVTSTAKCRKRTKLKSLTTLWQPAWQFSNFSRLTVLVIS